MKERSFSEQLFNPVKEENFTLLIFGALLSISKAIEIFLKKLDLTSYKNYPYIWNLLIF